MLKKYIIVNIILNLHSDKTITHFTKYLSTICKLITQCNLLWDSILQVWSILLCLNNITNHKNNITITNINQDINKITIKTETKIDIKAKIATTNKEITVILIINKDLINFNKVNNNKDIILINNKEIPKVKDTTTTIIATTTTITIITTIITIDNIIITNSNNNNNTLKKKSKINPNNWKEK